MTRSGRQRRWVRRYERRTSEALRKAVVSVVGDAEAQAWQANERALPGFGYINYFQILHMQEFYEAARRAFYGIP